MDGVRNRKDSWCLAVAEAWSLHGLKGLVRAPKPTASPGFRFFICKLAGGGDRKSLLHRVQKRIYNYKVVFCFVFDQVSSYKQKLKSQRNLHLFSPVEQKPQNERQMILS